MAQRGKAATKKELAAKEHSAASRNQRNGTTDFADFTDSESSIRSAHGTELTQKQTKKTKKNSSFVSFVPFCSKESVSSAIRGKIFAKMGDSDGPQYKDRKEERT